MNLADAVPSGVCVRRDRWTWRKRHLSSPHRVSLPLGDRSSPRSGSLVRHSLLAVLTASRFSAGRPCSPPKGRAASHRLGRPLRAQPHRRSSAQRPRIPLLGFLRPSSDRVRRYAQPGFASPGTFRPRGCDPLDGLLPPHPAVPKDCCRSWGSFGPVPRDSVPRRVATPVVLNGSVNSIPQL